MEGGPPIFTPDFTWLVLLVGLRQYPLVTGLSPSMVAVPGYSQKCSAMQGRLVIRMTRFRAGPISIASTLGISIDFFSCEY